MLILTVKVARAESREVETAKGRRTFKEQAAFIEVNDEVRKVRIPLDHDQAPYPAGRYTLSDSSFGVSRFHDLEINRYGLALVPVAAAQPALKAG